MAQPIIVTLTAPSCSGKSYLLNYIRQTIPESCVISTTTRPRRAGEEDGVDYHFISLDESIAIENTGGFAELTVHNCYRYGITREELEQKLEGGIVFLIVNPHGVESCAKLAEEYGARHVKCFVDSPWDIRITRLRNRLINDLEMAITNQYLADGYKKVALSHFDRAVTMLMEESRWVSSNSWDYVLDGTQPPHENLKHLLRFVGRL